jgi:hypothetical protein
MDHLRASAFESISRVMISLPCTDDIESVAAAMSMAAMNGCRLAVTVMDVSVISRSCCAEKRSMHDLSAGIAATSPYNARRWQRCQRATSHVNWGANFA